MRKVFLGEVVALQAGIGFPPRLQGHSEGLYPFAKVGDVSRVGRSGVGVLSRSDHYISSEVAKELRAKPVPKGTVLFAKIGEAIRQNHRVVVGQPTVFDNNVMAAVPGPEVDSRYLYRFLQTVDLYALASSTTVPSLRRSVLERITMPLPEISEQRRIADILDKADALRAKRREAIAHLDALGQSIFHEMFGDVSDLLEKVPSGKLQDYAHQITDGEHLTPRRVESGFPLLSARNVRSGYISWSPIDHVPSEEFERIAKRCAPRRGDVLISCSGTIGRVAPVVEDTEFVLVRSVALVRPSKEHLMQGYLVAYLQTPYMQSKMKRAANSSSQANLFQGPIRALPIAVPPLHDQERFVRNVAGVQRLRTQHMEQLIQLDNLFLSLQDRAFKGEL